VKLKDGQPLFSFRKTISIEKQLNQLNIPGLSFSILKNFEIIHTKYFGVKDLISKKKVDNHTLFEAGSTSKLVTAVVTLKLVEKGKLKLDKNVDNYLKDWKIPFSEKINKKEITLKQLLTHTSGINRPDSMFNVEEGKKPTILQVLKGEPPAINDPVKVEFTPGTNHKYSNFAYIIIEKIIEDVSKTTLPDLAKELIFTPLKMENSFFGYPTNEIKQRIILPHNEKGEPKRTGLHPTVFGHGGLITTTNDLAKFMLELMNSYRGSSDKLLSQLMIKEMLTPAIKLDPSKYFGFTGQGLGVFLMETDKELFFVHPGTNHPGAVCMFIGNPTSGEGFIAMSNGIQGEILHIQMLFAIAKEFNWPIFRI